MIIFSPSSRASYYITLFSLFFFLFNDPATTEIYTLSLHDALPISELAALWRTDRDLRVLGEIGPRVQRSEEHTSELQSRRELVCRFLLEKKKKTHPDSQMRQHNAKQTLLAKQQRIA